MQSPEQTISNPRKIGWKKALLGLLLVAAGTATLGWLNRKAIILYVASVTGKTEVAPHQAIAWDKGPETAELSAAKPHQTLSSFCWMISASMTYRPLAGASLVAACRLQTLTNWPLTVRSLHKPTPAREPAPRHARCC